MSAAFPSPFVQYLKLLPPAPRCCHNHYKFYRQHLKRQTSISSGILLKHCKEDHSNTYLYAWIICCYKHFTYLCPTSRKTSRVYEFILYTVVPGVREIFNFPGLWHRQVIQDLQTLISKMRMNANNVVVKKKLVIILQHCIIPTEWFYQFLFLFHYYYQKQDDFDVTTVFIFTAWLPI